MFEFPKLVFLMLAPGRDLDVYRWVNGPRPESLRRRGARPPGAIPAEDLVACGVCGAYVAAHAPGCVRPDCPRAGRRRGPLSFQSLIADLQEFWARQGCVILQPYDVEVGAGTFHPATALRALGPEPWRAAYVQPSRRPTDGRYGENPNRLQHYYQLQVILKPAPADSQDLYLASLTALGIDAAATTSVLSRTIGRARPWAPGVSAGRYGSTAWRSANSPIFSRSAASNATRSRPS